MDSMSYSELYDRIRELERDIYYKDIEIANLKKKLSDKEWETSPDRMGGGGWHPSELERWK